MATQVVSRPLPSDDVSPWDNGFAARESTTFIVSNQGTTSVYQPPSTVVQAAAVPATVVSPPTRLAMGDRAAVPRPAPTRRHLESAPAAANDDDDDDGKDSDAEAPSVASEASTAAMQLRERKAVRQLLKGTKIYFEAASPRDVVLLNAVESGCSVVHNPDTADITWIEAHPKSVQFVRSLTHQRINFFPGMRVASLKCEFSRLLGRISKLYPGDFPFIPKTFAIPADRAVLDEHINKVGPGQVYVVKPDGGCGGEGIYLTNDVKTIRHSECVVQEYVSDPLTIKGLKFDFRLYVVVTSIHPLRYYLHREGLGRMAVEPYEPASKANFHKLNMHLTNYSLNKFSSKFVDNTDAFADDDCTKRRASTAFRQLAEEYGDDFDTDAVWEDIMELVGKTLACIAPHILATTGELPGESNYLSRCFHLLGFDVLLDRQMKPHLLEINNHPSLQTDAPIDMFVKSQVVKPLVRMVCLDARINRRAMKAKLPFVAPTPEESAEWESQFTDEEHGWMPCDEGKCAALIERYAKPLMPLLRCFIDACGGARSSKYDEMSGARFARFTRKIGLAGPGCQFSGPEVDLLFIKILQKRGGGHAVEFYDFVDAMLGTFGDRISSHTLPGSLARLRDVSAQVCQ